MRSVAVFLSDEMTVRRLTVALRNQYAALQFPTIESVRDRIANRTVVAIVVDMHRDALSGAKTQAQAQYDEAVALISALHAEFPTVPILAYVDFTPDRARDIVAAAHAGVTDILLRDFDDPMAVGNRVIELCTMRDVMGRISDATIALVPAPLHDFLQLCVANAKRPINAHQALKRLAQHPDTMATWLASIGLPRPVRVLGWARILLAARHLEDTSRSVERIALDTGFASAAALRNMMRRYVYCTPDVVRQRGGFDYVLEQLVEELRTSARAPAPVADEAARSPRDLAPGDP